MGYHTCHGVVMGYRLIQPLPTRWWTNDDLAPAPGESPKSWSTKSTSDPQIVADPMTISYQLWKTSPGFTNFHSYKSFFSRVSPPKAKKTYSTKEEFFNTGERVSVLTNVKSTVFVGTTIPGDQGHAQTMESRWISRCSNDFCSQFWVMMIKGKQRKGVSSAKLKKKNRFCINGCLAILTISHIKDLEKSKWNDHSRMFLASGQYHVRIYLTPSGTALISTGSLGMKQMFPVLNEGWQWLARYLKDSKTL